MAHDLSIGGGKTVTIIEPTRDMFSDNLSGAFEFSLVKFIYNILNFFGDLIGSFIGGIAVNFLERIEPTLVKYSTPLIDLMLDSSELDPSIRTFLQQLRNPTDEAASLLLSGLASQAGGMLFNTVFDALLAPVTLQLNKRIRPALPDVSAIITMFRRGQISDNGMRELLSFSGYKDELIEGFIEITKSRPGIADYVEAYYRETISEDELKSEATKQGVDVEVVNLLISLKQRMLGASELLNAFYRGILTETELRRELNRQGFADEWITIWLQAVKPIPPLPDIIRLAVREAWRDDVASQWGYDEDFPKIVEDHVEKLGFDKDWAIRYWRAHWELPSVTMALSMVHRGIISENDFKALLRIADYPAGWRNAMTAAIYSPYTRVDARRMYRLGVLSEQELTAAYRAIGYDEEKARRLTEFTIKYESDDPDSKPDQYKKLTVGMLEKAYKKNLIDNAQYQTELMSLGYGTDEINIIISLADMSKMVDERPNYYATYQKDVTSIVERSYVRGMIDESSARGLLSSINVPEIEQDYMLAAADFANYESQREAQLKNIHDAYVNQAITELEAINLMGSIAMPGKEQDNMLRNWRMEKEVRARRLTEAQYRNAWRTGIINQKQYRDALQGLGYTDYDIGILIALYKPTE